MTNFTPNLRDMEFVLAELAGLDEIAALPGYEEASPELVHAVLEEAGRIAENVLAQMAQGKAIERIKVSAAKNGDFKYTVA